MVLNNGILIGVIRVQLLKKWRRISIVMPNLNGPKKTTVPLWSKIPI